MGTEKFLNQDVILKNSSIYEVGKMCVCITVNAILTLLGLLAEIKASYLFSPYFK